MDRETFKVDRASRTDILQWESNGHNGGGVVFGLDGMLYITTGDGTSDSDDNVTGQRIDLLLAKLLRVNVDKPEGKSTRSSPQQRPSPGIQAGSSRLRPYAALDLMQIHARNMAKSNQPPLTRTERMRQEMHAHRPWWRFWNTVNLP